jgi:iron complex outermembrane receptor protein
MGVDIRIRRLVTWLAGAALCWPRGAAAQADSGRVAADSVRVSADSAAVAAPAQPVLTLPPVEVPAARPTAEQRLLRRPGFARIVDVPKAYGRPRMVSDLVAGTAGVHVRQLGGIGSFSALSIRGAPSNQVAVYLDGVPLNSAQYGVVDAADLPIQALSRIEVYRGAAPLGFDSPGGGVIELVTRQDPGSWSGVSVGAGSYETERADIAAGWHSRGTGAMLVMQGLKSGGAFRYLDDNATPFNPADDVISIRQNNGTQSAGFTGRIEQQAGPLQLSLTQDLLALERGVPGTGADPALHSSYRADRSITNLSLRWRPALETGAGNPFLRLYAIGERDRFADPLGELTGLHQAGDDRTRKLGGQLQGEARLPLAAALGAALELRDERYEPSLVLPAPRDLPDSRRRVVQGSAELRETPSAWLELVAGAQRRATADDFAGGPPYPGALPVPATQRTTILDRWNAGLRAGPPLLSFKAMVARLPRMPTLEELFGNRGGIYGNPKAKPENILTRDAGLVSRWTPVRARGATPSWLESQFSAYRSDARDLLLYVQNSQRSSVAQNFSAARLEGLELGLRAGWGGGLLGEMSWTRAWTRDEGEAVYWRGMELPGHPRDEALLRMSLARRRWSASYEFHYVSRNFLDRYNAMAVGPRSLHDVALGLTPWSWSPEWTAECRNLSDQQVEDYAGYPLPGRAFYLGLRAQVDKKGMP